MGETRPGNGCRGAIARIIAAVALGMTAGLTIYTPGSTAGVPVNILGSLAVPDTGFDEDPETGERYVVVVDGDDEVRYQLPVRARLRVSEGEQAEILIGDRIPIPVTTFGSAPAPQRSSTNSGKIGIVMLTAAIAASRSRLFRVIRLSSTSAHCRPRKPRTAPSPPPPASATGTSRRRSRR